MSKEQIRLFDIPDEPRRQESLRRLRYPTWTESKAKLIERYLYYFVLITKHGAYIDGFAGPQEPDKPETWAAKLVVENEPRWLRHFYLFENEPEQFEQLLALKKSQNGREIRVFLGDFNTLVHPFLNERPIKETEASFCLLDHRTFECHWSTLKALATYKMCGMKIELFYFFPAFWLDRALVAQKDESVLVEWWGREDWIELRGMKSYEQALLVCNRFKEEFKYESVLPWPIFEQRGGGRVMYNMIHATDYLEASNLMYRAYHLAVTPKETPEQLQFEFEQWKSHH